MDATFNGSKNTDWAESDNWTVNLPIDSLNKVIDAWANPKMPYDSILGSNEETWHYTNYSATIPTGQQCVFNGTDTTEHYNFHGGTWYTRLIKIIVEKDAVLDFSYRNDSSYIFNNYNRLLIANEVYISGSNNEPSLEVYGEININQGAINTRKNLYNSGTITINEGGILHSKYPVYIGEKYVATVEGTENTEAVEEVNIQGQIVVNGGVLNPGNIGLRFRNHYEGNTKPGLVINSGMAWCSINDLLNADERGYGVSRPGQIEINGTGEFRLTGYQLSDLKQVFINGIFTSTDGIKVKLDDIEGAREAEVALSYGITAVDVDTNKDGIIDYVSLTVNKSDSLNIVEDDQTTGILSDNANTELNIYPNPTSDGTFKVDASAVSGNAAVTVVIGNTSGQVVYSQVYNGGSTINVNANLSTGIYLVTILSEGKVSNQKLIVK